MEKIDKPNFSFSEIIKSIIVKEIKKLNPIKTLQSNDIPKKLRNFLICSQQSLLKILTNALTAAPLKKISKYRRQNQFRKELDQLAKTIINGYVYFQFFPKIMKDICMNAYFDGIFFKISIGLSQRL